MNRASLLITAEVKLRSQSLGELPNLAETCNADTSLEMFRRMCRIRYFEFQVAKFSSKGFIKCPVYLSIGQESIAASISTVMTGSYVFAQHRAHSVYLAFGGDTIKLIDELLGLSSGCCGGMGGSPPIQDRNVKMIGHEGLIGEHIPIAVGAALGSGKEKVVCFFGDGAVEEDYIYGAIGFAATHKLPILFVCEDNDLSVLTPKRERRSWKIDEVARAMGISSIDITDDPWLIRHYVEGFSNHLPAFFNIRTCRGLWHVGTGTDGPPEWNRFELVKSKLKDLGLINKAETIEQEIKESIESLWDERLQIQSAK